MRTVALASGSNGNSIWVETRDARLLFDAGLSGKRLEKRANRCGIDLGAADALLISHDHSDHTCGAGVLHRRFGTLVGATPGTWLAAGRRIGRVAGRREFRAGETLEFGATRVHTLPTPHDGVDGVAFVVEEDGTRLGILTDLGHPFAELREILPTLDAAYLEANYEPVLLETGPYPAHLKARIAGPGGHLSNRECAELASDAGKGRLRRLVLSHLSGENNSPELARQSMLVVEEQGVEVSVASRHAPSDFLIL